MRQVLSLAGALLGLLLGASLAFAQACDDPGVQVDQGPPRVLIVMDASASMGEDVGDGSGTRLQAAKRALTQLVRGLPDDAQVGLELYGHRVAGPGTTRTERCRDVEVVAPVAPLDRAGLQRRIESYRAVGSTPIGRALREGAQALGDEGDTQLVLVSDGGDNCAPPQPCSVAADISRDGRAVAVQAIGFQVTPRAREQLECIARRGGGTYRDAQDADELALALRALAARAVRDYAPSGTRVRGATDPARAAPVRAGTSLDKLTVGQPRWYRITLARGQRLGAALTLRAPCSSVGIGGRGGSMQLDVRPPADVRAAFVPNYAQRANLFVTQQSSESVGLLSAPVGATTSGTGALTRSGTYLVRASLDDDAVGSLRRVTGGRPVAAELRLDVQGSPRLPRAAVVTEPGARGGGAVVIGLAVGGALLGALLGTALRRRRA